MGDPDTGHKDSGSCNVGSKERPGQKTEPDLVETERLEDNWPEVSVPCI